MFKVELSFCDRISNCCAQEGVEPLTSLDPLDPCSALPNLDLTTRITLRTDTINECLFVSFLLFC